MGARGGSGARGQETQLTGRTTIIHYAAPGRATSAAGENSLYTLVPSPEHCAIVNIRWFGAAALVLCCLCGFAPQTTAALAPGRAYAVKVWETDDGLPQNSVISMVQTRDGYLWLGTLNGLARFDGLRFTVFDESTTPGLNDSRIVFLFEDSQANLWIGTETAGTVMMKDGRVIAPEQLSLGGLEHRLISACEDADGAVWLYLANGDLWRYHRSSFSPLLVPGRNSSQARSIIKETNGPLWVATSQRQYAVEAPADGGSLELHVPQELPPSRNDFLVPSRTGGYWQLADFQIRKGTNGAISEPILRYPWEYCGCTIGAVCEDQDGNLVVGTRGAGLFWISPGGQVASLSTNEGLSNNYIFSTVVDREGTLWVGTDGGGLNRIKRPHFSTIETNRSWVVQSVCADGEGGLWIGSNGEGVGHWKDGQMWRFGPNEGLAGPYAQFVKSVFVDRAGRTWAGTRGSGLFRLENGRFQSVSGPGLFRSEVQAIHQDRAGRLWIGTTTGLVSWDEREQKRFTTLDGLTSDVITALAEDREGHLWVGTRRGGLNRLSGGKFTAFRKADGLPSDDISALWVDAQGVLWIATFGNGLARYHEGRWTRFTKREGLTSNNLGYIVEDGDGNLWLGSNMGVLRVSKKSLNDFASGLAKSVPCRAYGKVDGLTTLECTAGSQPGAARGADGRLWFPTIKGVVSVDPARLTPNPIPPLVTIDSVLVDDEPVTPSVSAANQGRLITLRAGQERMEIQYSGLNLGAPDRARFRYWLEGYEKDWVEAGRRPFVVYPKLVPGHFKFHVTACNEDDVWNERPISLDVIVQPPYWRTWWFYSASALCLFGLVAGIVHYLSTQKLQRQLALLKQQEALEKERSRIARDIHDQVGASLTQVALLGELVETDKNLPDEVQAHAQQISQTARETTRALDEIVWTVNPSNDTLEGLINYICKHAQEFLAIAGLRYRLEVPEDLPATSISPEVRHNVFLASKEAVTNIVRHAKATSAWVRLRLDASSFTLEIEDNGGGIADPDAPSVRNGLRNMRKRMEDIGGTFSITRGAEGGALVRLTVPITKSHPAPLTGAK